MVEYSGQSAFDQSWACDPSLVCPLVPVPVSFSLLFVSVYDLRSFLVVLMLMDGDLLSSLLILVLLTILLLLSELGVVG